MGRDDASTVKELKSIGDRIKSLRLGDMHPFGAESHCFELGAQRTESEICTFESQHKIELPTEYRLFLQCVGDGGAGPAYGLLSLGEACVLDSITPANSLLAVTFPHTEEYRPNDDPAFKGVFYPRFPAAESVTSTARKEHHRRLVAGTLALCHEGCGYYHRLVVTGPTRGAMWLDGRVSDQGFFPLKVSFLEWYKRWYEDMLHGNDGIWWARST